MSVKIQEIARRKTCNVKIHQALLNAYAYPIATTKQKMGVFVIKARKLKCARVVTLEQASLKKSTEHSAKIRSQNVKFIK